MLDGTKGIFVDRCLSNRVARGLPHFAGLESAYLHEVFSNGTRTQDVQFLGACGQHGWAIFTQNPKMIDVEDEVQAIEEHGAHVFCLAKATYGLEGSGLIFGRHLLTIRRRMAKPGGCFWLLFPDRIAKPLG